MPASLPSRSHTAAPAMRLSRSHAAAPATRLARPLALEAATTPSRADVACTPYATVAATPKHTTTPLTDNTQTPAPSQQPPLPTIVVKRFPNWEKYFRTIYETLGHGPNARAHLEGIKFEPRSIEELRTIRRVLEEAAASDRTISYYETPEGYEIPEDTDKEEKKTPPTHTITPQDATSLPATAEPGDNAPPTTIPAVSAASDETQDGSNTPESAVPLPSRRRRRKRAPRPTSYSSVAGVARRPPLLPTPTAWRAHAQASQPCHNRHHQAPSSLDRTVRVILEALTTGIAAYLREQGAMPVPQHPTRHKAQSQDWRARAGEIPAQKTFTGEVHLPRA